MLKASLKRYFLTGLLIMIPFWGTILILKTLFVSLDGILGDAAARLVTPGYYVPGLGIVALILLIFATGLFAANFIGRHVVRQRSDFSDLMLHARSFAILEGSVSAGYVCSFPIYLPADAGVENSANTASVRRHHS